MATFFQMMAKHPEVVKRVHLDIDSITYKERLPTLDDRKDLPIVDCVMREVFRCVPSAVIEDLLTLLVGSIRPVLLACPLVLQLSSYIDHFT